jgi:hypothetical protein
MKKHILTPLLASLAITGASKAQQASLSPGDIVFVSANADTPDEFSFIPLVNLSAGTVIHFTDNGRTDTGTGFSSWRLNVGAFNEGPVYTYVAASAVAAGTKISLPDTSHGMAFATAGDTVLAFQGSVYQPSFIAGIGWSSTDPFIVTGSATANNSYLPSTLTLATNAVELGNLDNFGYTGATTTGTAGALRAAATTTANWTGNDTTVQSGPAGFTVSGAVDAPAATKQTLGYSFGNTTATYTANALVDPLNVSLSAFSRTGTGVVDTDGGNVLVGQAFGVTGGMETGALNFSSSQALTFTVTVESGYKLALEDFGFSYQSSTNTTLALYYSTDGFATQNQLGSDIAVTNTNVGSISLTALTPANLTGDIAFRFYAFNSTLASGLIEIDEVWAGVSITPIPEPSAYAALAGAGMIGFALYRRRRQSAAKRAA